MTAPRSAFAVRNSATRVAVLASAMVWRTQRDSGWLWAVFMGRDCATCVLPHVNGCLQFAVFAGSFADFFLLFSFWALAGPG
jgi:hypothetical protein